MKRSRRQAWLPSEGQELLLRAALEDGDDALGAWSEWKREGTLDEMSAADHQVLPLLARNISRLDPSDPDLARLKGFGRHHWVRNQLLLRFGADAIRKLNRAGIETLVLKGPALAVLCYPDIGARPMLDFDALVRREEALDAIAVLREDLRPREIPAPAEQRIEVEHGVPFSDPLGNEFDLHWYLLWRSSPTTTSGRPPARSRSRAC